MAKPIRLYTIGFTQTTAQHFFERLQNANIRRVIDTRLNNASQLAGFAKKRDLEFFLQAIANIDYQHQINLAPTPDILNAYKKQKGDWDTYEHQFLHLMRDRHIETQLSPEWLDGACLLCSEAKPHHCHRRLVAEYLNHCWGNIIIEHL